MPISAQPQKPADRAYDAPARCFPMRVGSQLTDEEMATADEHITSLYGGDVATYAANNTVEPLSQQEFNWATSVFKLKADVAELQLCNECREDDAPYCSDGNCIACCEMTLCACCNPHGDQYPVPSFFSLNKL